MEQRLEAILKAIVDEYIRSAEPVGSRFLAEHGIAASPATIRNNMVALEEMGFIAQPHTSSGRIPTEKAYVYYLQNFVGPERMTDTKNHESRMKIQKRMKAEKDEGDPMRALAKTLMGLSGEMALVAVDPRRSYYAGVGNLFEKPDFGELSVVRELSHLLDRFDDVMGEVFDRVQNETEVMIGSDNPFGKDMSAIMVKCRLPNGQIGILGLIGPMRMDYEKNLGLVEGVRDILDE